MLAPACRCTPSTSSGGSSRAGARLPALSTSSLLPAPASCRCTSRGPPIVSTAGSPERCQRAAVAACRNAAAAARYPAPVAFWIKEAVRWEQPAIEFRNELIVAVSGRAGASNVRAQPAAVAWWRGQQARAPSWLPMTMLFCAVVVTYVHMCVHACAPTAAAATTPAAAPAGRSRFIACGRRPPPPMTSSAMRRP